MPPNLIKTYHIMKAQGQVRDEVRARVCVPVCLCGWVSGFRGGRGGANLDDSSRVVQHKAFHYTPTIDPVRRGFEEGQPELPRPASRQKQASCQIACEIMQWLLFHADAIQGQMYFTADTIIEMLSVACGSAKPRMMCWIL